MGDKQNQIGKIAWQDLTVNNADDIRDFYSKVTGWQTEAHSMGDYNDYDVIAPGSGEVVAGICHARGENANIPAQWLIYITVEDVAASAAKCEELGGKILDGPRKMGKFTFCVIQDPAGAIAGIISS